ncbi:MAG: DUF167 domain-containing protein [Ammonifex sp.]|jgi:uncharacterized protein (TIGR00251 family)|nr:MAG: DUF167 domain-containing protein [Ammonifex sp.]
MVAAAPDEDLTSFLREDKGAVVLHVRVTPRASASSVEGLSEGVLRVRVSAPPVNGRANRALLKYLGDVLSVPVSRLSILRGESSREKAVRVEGLPAAVAAERIRRALKK